MGINIELLLLVVSVLFFVSILASKAGYRLGVPALLLFLAVGMLFGSDGLGIHFESIYVAQTIGTVALCIILFSGGMDTKLKDIRPIIPQGVVLATVGVLLTALTTGLATWWILGFTMPAAGVGLTTAILLAATMSSTDSASVFSILRSKGLHLKNNLRPTLELESGSNDPMAYVLTITLISLVQQATAPNYWYAIAEVLMQLVIGGVMGLLLGKIIVLIVNKLKIDNGSLYPILVLTFCIFIFSATYYVKGNGYLAVYIGGLVIGNSKFVHKRSTLNFFDGLSWLSQLLLFLTLGLLVNPRELIPIAVPGLIISFIMIFITRPLSVYTSLLPFRKISRRDKAFISWVGLRGAVPIIFAIITLAENVPHARLIFNIVFFCTLVSLVLQGTTLPLVAKWMGVADNPKEKSKIDNFDIDFPEEIKSATSEIEVTQQTLKNGNMLMNLGMPEKTLVIMVKRGEVYFVPTGKTILKEKDKLLIITDDDDALAETYRDLGHA
ncbi:MAG: potassium/proton antiporter [Bacteroidales bacterium]|jgi:potassium/hydrogen antiporter|nr:potassium/proton antiporter [Bacteroidales bacterium]